MTSTTIALDAMGGDQGPRVVLPAALMALDAHPQLSLILVGNESLLTEELHRLGAKPSQRLQLHHASEVVAMDESPSLALRNKKDSSMRVAINMVKTGQAAACVSAGNTGALMATARFVLKTLPGIKRPAIMTAFPTVDGRCTRLLDLGANVDSEAEHLFQFAVMGSVLVAAVDEGNPKPRVALLNVGEEEIKGNEQVKQTAMLLQDGGVVNYIGYVEGNDIYKGVADVIVCDGFVGNIALKSSEGVAKLISQYIREAFNENILTRLAGLVALPVLRRLARRLDPARYNGASLLGLKGIVIKSHGGTSVLGFANAIKEALSEVAHNVPERISQQVALLLEDAL